MRSPYVQLLDPCLGERDRYALMHAIPAGPVLWKNTAPGRLHELDELIEVEARKRFPADHPLRIHDAAASTAITSVELFHRLAATWPRLTFRASDWYDAIHFSRLGPLWFARDADGRLIQASLGRLTTRHFPAAVARLAGSAQSVSLFDPAAIALAQCDPRFTLARQDIFAPDPSRYDIIRAMNVLTPEMPNAEQGKRNLLASLADGGLLIVGDRTGYAFVSP